MQSSKDLTPTASTIFRAKYLQLIRDIIEKHALTNWLDTYEWLTGHLGDPQSPIWFVAENPSSYGVNRIAERRVDGRKLEASENLQWNCHAVETRMFREALTESHLKAGELCAHSGWKCYITNAIKAPDVVKDRNARKNAVSMREEAEVWWPVLQFQIDYGKPHALVALGGQTHKLLKYMCDSGLRTAANIICIPHYSYVMKRPAGRIPPGAPERIEKFKAEIEKIAQQYGRQSSPQPKNMPQYTA